MYCEICHLHIAPYDTKITKKGDTGAHNSCLDRKKHDEENTPKKGDFLVVWAGAEPLIRIME